ncbi:MAG TPA: glycosyl hydrolase family 28-related protein [Tepidisphaeraceae bacterium]|nr:glycosyl hydrolase family 28-related protein [Tepidisphaeraceae bacterium]
MKNPLICLISLLFVQVGFAAAPAQPLARWNAAEMGAVADEQTDNTAALQKALNIAGQAGGGIVELPAGRYRVNGNLSIPAGVTLQGTYRVPPTAARKIEKPDGTVLLAYAGRGSEQGPAFIRLAGRNSAIAGLVVTYPEWKQTDVPPVPYPPCVESHDTENVGIQDCCFLNPYEAIKLVRSARHLVRNITGYPSKRGIYVDECYDIGKIENIHFWPFGVAYKADDPYCKWVNTQGVAFELARTDWHYVLNTFCFGYGVGYKFSESKAGSANGNFLGLGADSCRRAVVVDQAQPAGLLITNGEFVGRWGSTDSVCIEIGPKAEGKVSLVNCSFWGPIDRCIWMRSPVGQVTASACHFENWDTHSQGAAAIQLDAGKAVVQGCTFSKEGTHVQAGQRVRSAILTSNQAYGGFRVDNQAGKRTQLLANEEEPLELSPEARSHYRLSIGEVGDGQYLSQWNGRERVGQLTMRWSSAISQFILPVVPGKPYRLTLELAVPKEAQSPDAGIYLAGKRIASIEPGATKVVADLPASTKDRVTIELRCRGWVPKDTKPGSEDNRTLGLSVYSVRMQAKDATDRVFNANTGDWLR